MKLFFTCLCLIASIASNAQSPRLWGMTSAFDQLQQYGTIFSINLDGSDYQIEYVFSESSGYDNRGGLCQAPNGKLYGVTKYGGLYGEGSVFSFDPSTGQFEKHFDIDYGQIGPSWGTPLLASDGYIYGAGVSNMFRLDPATDVVEMLAPYNVNEGLIQTPDGFIYGSEPHAGYNGTFGNGLLYRFDPVSMEVEELHEFMAADGAQPYARLCMAENGKLYGITHDGGMNDGGLVYEYDRVLDEFTVVAHLGQEGASACWAGFISVGPDLLLNTTVEGGTYNDGTICSFRPSTGTLNVVHSFDQNAFPFGGLMRASNGWIYGMTNNGGNGAGTIFRFDTLDYSVNVIFQFPGAMEGHSPHAELLEVGGTVGSVEHGTAPIALNVFPNPVSGSAKLSIGNGQPGTWLLTLTDALGKVVWTRQTSSPIGSIDLPETNGVYTLSVIGEQTSGVARIAVQ